VVDQEYLTKIAAAVAIVILMALAVMFPPR
jgi:hypothetical protein